MQWMPQPSELRDAFLAVLAHVNRDSGWQVTGIIGDYEYKYAPPEALD